MITAIIPFETYTFQNIPLSVFIRCLETDNYEQLIIPKVSMNEQLQLEESYLDELKEVYRTIIIEYKDRIISDDELRKQKLELKYSITLAQYEALQTAIPLLNEYGYNEDIISAVNTLLEQKIQIRETDLDNDLARAMIVSKALKVKVDKLNKQLLEYDEPEKVEISLSAYEQFTKTLIAISTFNKSPIMKVENTTLLEYTIILNNYRDQIAILERVNSDK